MEPKIVETNVVTALPFSVCKMKDGVKTIEDTLVSGSASRKIVKELTAADPTAEYFIEKNIGGLKTQVPPKFFYQHETEGDPFTYPHWSGKNPPPKVGDTVTVKLNRLGPGIVTAYMVHDGYLGVMVQLTGERELWHINNNPNNEPSLIFGRELA